MTGQTGDVHCNREAMQNHTLFFSSPSSYSLKSSENQIPLFIDKYPEHRAAEIGRATSNYLFSSVAELKQKWSNTRYRNGHMIAVGSFPLGTVLYVRI
jgi:hypothetical protein